MHQCSRNAHLLTEGLTILLWWTPHILLFGTLDMYFFSSNILGKKITAFSLYRINRPPPLPNHQKQYPGIMGLTVLGEKFFINAEELGEKKMFESLRTATDESLIAMNHQIHTAGDLNVKNPLFSVVQKYNGMYATNNAWITNISPLYCFFHFSLKFSVSFFF